MILAGSTPPSINRSSAAFRSSSVNDENSPVVPNRTRPLQPLASSQIASRRSPESSIAPSGSSGVNIAANTPDFIGPPPAETRLCRVRYCSGAGERQTSGLANVHFALGRMRPDWPRCLHRQFPILWISRGEANCADMPALGSPPHRRKNSAMNAAPEGSLLRRLGVKPVINACGIYTDLGGSRLSPGVWAAMAEANRSFVRLTDLLDSSGAQIARLLGAESARITPGAAAAIVLGTAACLAGTDGTKSE